MFLAEADATTNSDPTFPKSSVQFMLHLLEISQSQMQQMPRRHRRRTSATTASTSSTLAANTPSSHRNTPPVAPAEAGSTRNYSNLRDLTNRGLRRLESVLRAPRRCRTLPKAARATARPRGHGSLR
jgi:hypothetical protein